MRNVTRLLAPFIAQVQETVKSLTEDDNAYLNDLIFKDYLSQSLLFAERGHRLCIWSHIVLALVGLGERDQAVLSGLSKEDTIGGEVTDEVDCKFICYLLLGTVEIQFG